jgi:uncharacterized tellurite resistance protein B-like protein
MLVLSENWVRLLTAMISSDGTIYEVELESLERILEEYTSFPSSILTEILSEMPLQGEQLDGLILDLTSEIPPKEVLFRIGLLYKIAVVEGPLVPEESDILVRTITSLLGEEGVEVTLSWLEQQRLADVQLQALLEQYTS